MKVSLKHVIAKLKQKNVNKKMIFVFSNNLQNNTVIYFDEN